MGIKKTAVVADGILRPKSCKHSQAAVLRLNQSRCCFFRQAAATIGGCRHAVICPITIRWFVKKSLVLLTGYSGQPYETVHHVTCNMKPRARLDFIQSGFFAFFNNYFQVTTQSLPIEATPTVVVTKGENKSPAFDSFCKKGAQERGPRLLRRDEAAA